MRRAEREIVDPDDIEAILKRCPAMRIAISTDDFPYVVPVNFGFARDGDRFVFYFHSSRFGRKAELLEIDRARRVGLEFDRVLGVGSTGELTNPCACSCAYESVVGEGIVSRVEGDEKKRGLDALLRAVGFLGDIQYDARIFDATNVYRIDVVSISGKRNATVVSPYSKGDRL